MSTPIFSEGDHGILYETTVLGTDKKPFSIDSNNVRVYIVNPEQKTRILDSAAGEVSIKDALNGVIQFTLTEDDTNKIGAGNIYVEVYGATFEVSTVTPLIYVIVAKNGGAA